MGHRVGYLLAILALAGTLSAAPQGQLAARAIRNDDFNKMYLYAQYAAASYCYANNGNAPNPTSIVNCSGAFSLNNGKSNCPDVESNKGKVVKTFTGSQPHNTTGFIAVDDVKQLIVVSFRGSEPLRSRVPDSNTNLDSLNAQVTATVYCTDCAAAKGYYESFMEVNKTVIEAVQAQRQLHADYQVVTTGHSLGGSLSMFAALELRRLGVNVHSASYGMPRSANPQLAQYMTTYDPITSSNPTPKNEKERNFRVIHAKDYVPDSIGEHQTSPAPTREYRHFAPAFNITTAAYVVPTASDIVIVDDIHKSNGGSAIGSLLNPENHRWYMEYISACY